VAGLPCASLILDVHVTICSIETSQDKVSAHHYHVAILQACAKRSIEVTSFFEVDLCSGTGV